jgi:RNA polymerase sigma-70 factor (ECF subfamily)
VNEDYDKADISSYKHTRQELVEGPECKYKAWMVSNLDYAIEWLETGRRPGNKRGVERLAAYQREIPTDVIEKYMQPTPPLEVGYTEQEWNHAEFILSMLTDRERECFEMYVVGQSSYREIGELLGINHKTVEENVKRAQNKIKSYKTKPVPILLDIVV